MSQFRLMAGRVHDATSHHDVFLEADERSIKKTYRAMTRVVHPDRVPLDCRVEASQVFDKLTRLFESAQQALGDGSFRSSPPLMVLESATMRHEVTSQYAGHFDMTTGYDTLSHGDSGLVSSIVKVAQTPRDNELLAAEADALKLLTGTGQDHSSFFPSLLDSFALKDGSKRLRANAIVKLDGFVDLEKVRQRYHGGLDPLDMAWIWRRVLWALGGAHEAGVLHGALVPSHIMIHPTLHGVVLVDWCYSVLRSDANYPPLKAVVSSRRDWYLTAILKRQAPTEAHDIALAAHSMQFLMEGASTPDIMKQYFEQLAGGDSHASAYQLLDQFDRLLERLGAPYYPRVYRPLNW